MMRTVFFDLGGVLVNFSHEKMCQNIAHFCGLNLDLVKAHLFEKNLGEDYERGQIDSHTIHQHFMQLTKRPLDFDGLLEAASSIFSPKEEMLPILEELKKQEISLFLLSNTCEAHFWYVQKHYPFLKLFDGFVLSYEVKARKPEEAIYDAALEMSGAHKSQCFYVDDIAEYVAAAKSYGIDSHHFEGAEKLTAALEKRDINITRNL